MVAVDTDVLVRWLVRDDPELTKKADALFEKAKPATILLDRIILAELCYVLKSVYSFTKPDICTNLKALTGDDRFSIPDRTIVEAMIALFESHSPLSPEDAWLLAWQKNNKVVAILTFDKALCKLLKA